MQWRIRSGAMNEKTAACTVLASIFDSCGACALPYVEKCLPILFELSGYPHPFVRHGVLVAIQAVIELLSKVSRAFSDFYVCMCVCVRMCACLCMCTRERSV
jgi:hypothetical protein